MAEEKKTPEQLQAEVDALNAKLEATEKAKKAAEKKVAGFEKSGAKDLTVKGTVEIDGEKWGFKTGCLKFNLDGEVIESKEALKDKDLMIRLHEMGYGGIEKK